MLVHKFRTIALCVVTLLALTTTQIAVHSQGFEGCAGAIQWNADDTQIAATCANGRLDIFDLQSREVISTIVDSSPVFAWHPTLNNILAYVTLDQTQVVIWDFDANSRVNTFSSENLILSLAWKPDGNMIAIGDGSLWRLSMSMGTFKIWDVSATPELIYTARQYSEFVSQVAWNGDGTQLAGEIIDDINSYVVIYDLEDNIIREIVGNSFETEGDAGEVFRATTPIDLVGWNYDGNWFITTSLDRIHVRNAFDYQVAAEYRGYAPHLNDISIHPVANFIAVALRGRVVILNFQTEEVVQTIDVGVSTEAYTIEWNHDGTQLAYSTDSDGITVIDFPIPES